MGILIDSSKRYLSEDADMDCDVCGSSGCSTCLAEEES